MFNVFNSDPEIKQLAAIIASGNSTEWDKRYCLTSLPAVTAILCVASIIGKMEKRYSTASSSSFPLIPA